VTIVKAAMKNQGYHFIQIMMLVTYRIILITIPIALSNIRKA